MESVSCKKCGTIFHRPLKGYKKEYCSRACANSRSFTEETNLRRSVSNQKFWANQSVEQLQAFGEKVSASTHKRVATYEANFMAADFDSLKLETKRRRIMIEQECKCLICGLSEWMDKSLTLELDHIDGNNKNNSRENLRYLCPNCHSQTETWRGRNNKGKLNSRYKTRPSSTDGIRTLASQA